MRKKSGIEFLKNHEVQKEELQINSVINLGSTFFLLYDYWVGENLQLRHKDTALAIVKYYTLQD